LTVKRKQLLKHNLLLNEKLRMHEDTEFIIKLAHYCRIYPSEITVPTSKRSVHDDNRITANQEKTRVEKQTNRYKQWLSLHNWAEKKSFDDSDILPHFKDRLTHYKLSKEPDPKIRLLLKKIRQHPKFLKSRYYPPVHNIYFNKLGRYPRAGLFRLRNLLIKLY